MRKISNLLTIFTLVLFISCKGDKTKDATVGAAGEVAKKTSKAKIYNLEGADAQILWTGSKPAGKHSGFIKATQGEIAVEDDKITSATVIFNMNTITCTDLEGDSKAKLEAHLKGTTKAGKEDFFDVTTYPTATFKMTKITELKNDPVGNSLIYGNLTIKSVTKEVAFKASTYIDGNRLRISSQEFTINRTDWGIKFKSKNFIEGLKDKFIDDEIKLEVRITIA